MPRIIYRPTPNIEGIVDSESVRGYNLDFVGIHYSELTTGDCLVTVDLTENTIAEEAVKLIACFVKSMIVRYVAAINCTALDIEGGPNQSQNAMKALILISKSLEEASRLTTVILSGNFLGETGLEKLKHLFIGKFLRHVDLSDTNLTGTKAATTLVQYFKNSRRTLSHFSINNNPRLGSEGAKIVGSHLASKPKRMIHAEAGNVGAGDGGAFIVKGLEKLVDNGNRVVYVNLKGLQLGPMHQANQDAFEEFVQHDNLRNLEYIDVSSSGMGKEKQDEYRKLLLSSNRNLTNNRIVFGDNNGNEETEEESQFVSLSMI